MAKNLKGGYKIVSLNGLDLVGESLAIAGLYDKLAKSYDKPILVTGIVIDGEKKKNAFVQVEVLDDGIKINDLYGYDLLVEEDGDITVSANPQELPNTADASAGQVLKLDAQKKPVWGDEAEELPSTASASQGNALLLDAEKKPVWGAISGGTKLYEHIIKLQVANNPPEYIYFRVISLRSTPYENSEVTQGAAANFMTSLCKDGIVAWYGSTESDAKSGTTQVVKFELGTGGQYNRLNGYVTLKHTTSGSGTTTELKYNDMGSSFTFVGVEDTVTEL